MNSVQIHLALTHVPVMLSIIGFMVLIASTIKKNSTLLKTAYILLVAAGVTAVPVFLTGEGAEEAIEHLPGVSEGIIEEHEEVAQQSMFAIAAAGLVALAALIVPGLQATARILKGAVMILGVASLGLMVETAHLGGLIRHTELRDAVALRNSSEGGNQPEVNTTQQEKEDDD